MNEVDSKHAECEGNLCIDPHLSQEHVDSNSTATTGKVGVALRRWKADGGLKTGERETRSMTAQLERAAKATTDTSPEPVTKGKLITVTGKPITVTGKLIRANRSAKKLRHLQRPYGQPPVLCQGHRHLQHGQESHHQQHRRSEDHGHRLDGRLLPLGVIRQLHAQMSTIHGVECGSRRDSTADTRPGRGGDDVAAEAVDSVNRQRAQTD